MKNYRAKIKKDMDERYGKIMQAADALRAISVRKGWTGARCRFRVRCRIEAPPQILAQPKIQVPSSKSLADQAGINDIDKAANINITPNVSAGNVQGAVDSAFGSGKSGRDITKEVTINISAHVGSDNSASVAAGAVASAQATTARGDRDHLWIGVTGAIG